MVQFNHQYNDYNQEHDDNFALLQHFNEERSVEFNLRACNTHTEKRLRWGNTDGYEKKLLALDTRQWVKGDVEGPEQYPEGLEKKFRDLRIFALDDLVKVAPEPAAPLDQLVKNGKYLTDTQLKYVLAHLGLSSHALVNAPNVDAPQKKEGAAAEKQKLEFFRELVQKGIVPGDIIAMEANDQLGLIFHWMVDRIPP